MKNPGLNLADIIARHATATPDNPAVAFEGRTLTYAAFSARVEALAAGLGAHCQIAPGDRIAHLGCNSADMLALFFAAARLGAMLMPLNWRLAAAEQEFMLGHGEPGALFIEPDFAERIPGFRAAAPQARIIAMEGASGADFTIESLAWKGGAPPLADPDANALLVYTSGTTGRPKGAMLSQTAIRANAWQSADMHGLTAADHVLNVLPMFHVGGLNIQTVPALLAGARVTLHRRFDPGAALKAIREARPSLLVLVPAAMQAVMDHPDFAATGLSSLRCLTTGSTIVEERFVEVFAARGVRLIQVYGATETGPVAIYERFNTKRAAPGTTGGAGILTQAKIADDNGASGAPGAAGEIVLQAPNLFSGYWRDREATAAAFRDGWFLTGDIGSVDENGQYIIHERKKNLIISGGENIYPAEIERVIREFPGVADCAVAGRPDPRWQEIPVAFVVLRNGAEFNEPGLRVHLERQLARYKLPREIILRDSLPRNAMGKVLHFELKAELASRAEG